MVNDIFSPLALHDFKSHYFNKTSVHISGRREKFDGIICWQDLNDLLDVLQYPNDDIRLVKDLEYRNCDSLSGLRSGLNDGFTLVFNNLHERFKPVGNLAERIGEFFGEPTQVNLYLSHPRHNGFALHYDNHDVLVFQIFGSKVWQIWQATVEKPVVLMRDHDSCPPSTDPYLVAGLKAGDLLYVPRGHWHFAKPAPGEPSLHLTLGLLSRTGLDFLDWLKGELANSPLWRDSFTFRRFFLSALLKQSLAELLQSDRVFERFDEYCLLNRWNVRHLGLPYCYSGLSSFQVDGQIVFMPPLLSVIKKREDGTIVLLFKNTKIVLKDAAEPLVDYLLMRNDLDLTKLDQYAFGVTDEQALTLVQKLLAVELLRVR